ncbi:MAG: ParA family protein [Firmicutes bacterium]|nr:ParA family protein [Bacillota bacterium]
MGRVIAVANQKGGVGKTTTAINLSAFLAQKNKSVLVVDSDPQGNTTTGLGLEKNNGEKTFYDLLTGNADFFEVKKHVEYFNAMDILPTDINLAGAEIELVELDRPNYILKDMVDSLFLRDRYDYIIIDCPPSLNILTLNALVAADSVLIPLQCEFLALEGLTQFLHTYNIVKNKLNAKIEIEGIVFTMYDSRNNLSLQVVEEVKNFFDNSIYKCIIPRNVRLSEAPSHGMPINLYDPKSKGAEAYELLADTVIEHEKR